MHDIHSISDCLSFLGEGQFVVYDTEYTAWPGSMQRGWSGEGEHRELIQIGAAILDTSRGLEVISTLDVFVVPVINPKLSGYIQDLTGISQAEVEGGLDPREALSLFSDFAGDMTCWSYGGDEKVLDENCDLVGFPRVSGLMRFGNLKPHFAARGIATDQHCSGTLHQAVGREMKGRVHNALFDVMSIRECLIGLELVLK